MSSKRQTRSMVAFTSCRMPPGSPWTCSRRSAAIAPITVRHPHGLQDGWWQEWHQSGSGWVDEKHWSGTALADEPLAECRTPWKEPAGAVDDSSVCPRTRDQGVTKQVLPHDLQSRSLMTFSCTTGATSCASHSGEGQQTSHGVLTSPEWTCSF